MKRVAYILIAVCILGIGAYLVTRSAGTDGEAANDIEVASADEPPAPTRTHQVRSPAAAGKFYPGHRETLRQTVDSYLQKAGDVSPSGSVIAVIAPHAG